jgi:hypothetical protein
LEDGSGYRTINSSLIENAETLEFIKEIGISQPSLRDEINNFILPQYVGDDEIDTIPHFKKFFRYYQSCSAMESKSFISLIEDFEFVDYSTADDDTQYRGKADELYFPNEPLQQWFETKPDTKFVSFDDYLKIVGEEKREELVDFLSSLGVRDTPRVLTCELDWQQAHHLPYRWSDSTRYNKWIENCIDGCKELMVVIETQHNIVLSVSLWSQLLKYIESGILNVNSRSRDSLLYGRHEYFYYCDKSEIYESSEARRLRTLPWLMNAQSDFVSAKELTRQSINSIYDTSSDEAAELFHILGIEDDAELMDVDGVDLSSLGEQLGLSEEEGRQALLDYAKKKKEKETDNTHDIEDDEDDDIELSDDNDDVISPKISKPSIKRVGKEITERATSAPKEHPTPNANSDEETTSDEDDYSRPPVDISKQIEKVKEQAAREIQEITRLEDLKQKAQEAERYTYGWFNALLELESINSGENNANSREITISFAKVEREKDTLRTLVLKHPSRYIPQSMEDLADIPLELHFADQPMKRVAVEVVNVKSYTLRAKLRTNADVDGIDLARVIESRIVARNPVFLIEELRRAFLQLGKDNGYDDDFNMQEELCENIEFVFGPPGTGKTTHVAKDIILPLMKSPQDLKVLVLTPTNKSADVLVRRLMESMGSDQSYMNWLVRFGATNDTFIEQSGVFRDKTFDIRTFPRNVTVTTIARFPYDYFLPDAVERLHLNALKWDYIIIDEASMIPLANILYPLYKKTPEKFIIAGDPFQIEPITTVDTWKDENIYTMVELDSFTEPMTIPHDYHVELLTTQYRSIPEIGEVFSRFTYGGVLKHYRTSDSQRLLPIGDLFNLKSLNIIKFPVSKYESIYRPKQLQGKSPYQVYSALFAFEYVKSFAALIDLHKEDEIFRIGLIAPYRAQADLIDKLMTSVVFPKNIDVQVGTIHGFQGDECDVIIALFNPPPSISTNKNMFLNKLNIINVSISRARDYLIVLMPDDETEKVENLSLVKKVETLCKEQPSCIEQLSPLVEEIILGSKTYLEDNSFSTSHQLVNVYGKPEKRYEVRSEDNAVDVQVHDSENS